MMTRPRLHYLLFVIIAVAASFIVAGDAMAQSAAPAADFTGLLDLIASNASQWNDRLEGYALTVFASLALIQLVWTFFPLVFKQADLGEIVGELIRFVIVIGFFYALLMNSSVWAGNIVDSFRQAGASAAGLGSTGIRPGDIFVVAVELAKTVGDVETWNPLTAMLVALAGVLVLLCFAFIAAFMGLTIIESYIVINASVLFMGFGGASWTREYAIAMLRYALAVGAKLFVLTLLVGLVITSAKDWQAAYNATDDASMWTMIGLALTCAYFCKTLPELIAGLITGVSLGGGGAIGGLATAGLGAGVAGGVAVGTLATGGAAAPVAAGATGTAGGGLAGSLSASMAGGATASSASLGGTASATGAAASATGGSGLGGAGATSTRAGGNGLGAVTGGGNNTASGAVGRAAGKALESVTQGGDSGTGSTPPRHSLASLHVPGMDTNQSENLGSDRMAGAMKDMASAGLKIAGSMIAMSTPGAEGAAHLSAGGSGGGNTGGVQTDNGEGRPDFEQSSENTIRAADPVTESTATVSPAPQPANNNADSGTGSTPPGHSLASLQVPGMVKPSAGDDA